MKQKDKEQLIRYLPLAILIAGVGTLTNYNILYTALAGAIGGLIGHFFLKFYKRRSRNPIRNTNIVSRSESSLKRNLSPTTTLNIIPSITPSTSV